MELLFSKQGNVYVAEFEITADANLHIERPSSGYLSINQRSVNGKYALVDGVGNYAFDKVIDADLASIVYPKTIKIESSVEPTYAAITTSGEVTEIKSQSKEVEIVSNGTTEITPDAGYSYLSGVSVKVNVPQEGGGGGNWRYYLIDITDATMLEMIKTTFCPLISLVRIGDAPAVYAGGALVASGMIDRLTGVAINENIQIYIPNVGFGTPEEWMAAQGASLDMLESHGFIRITEEEFYNLNA